MSNTDALENSIKLEKLHYHLLYISKMHYKGEIQKKTHAHHCTELFYVMHGTGQFIVENQTFMIKKDDLIIINPNVSHTEFSENNDTLEYMIAGIKGLQFLKNEKGDNEFYKSLNCRHMKQEILFYLKTLMKEMQEKQHQYEQVCQNLLEVLITNIVRHTKEEMLIAPTQKITKECLFIEQYINAHFTEDITLEVLSEKAYMNKFYLVHAFKEYKGISPINYLIHLRIKHARMLLETTNFSIAQISVYSGFSSQSYFSQVFKRITNMTPNEYRKYLK